MRCALSLVAVVLIANSAAAQMDGMDKESRASLGEFVGFADASFKSTREELDIHAMPADSATELPSGLHDKLDSAEWNLEDGTFVHFCQDADGTGGGWVFFGKGCDTHFGDEIGVSQFGNDATSYVVYRMGVSKRPHKASDLSEKLDQGKIRLHEDSHFRGGNYVLELKQTDQWIALPKTDGVSSIEFNIPANHIVVMETAHNEARNIVLFGAGQFHDLKSLNINDKNCHRCIMYKLPKHKHAE